MTVGKWSCGHIQTSLWLPNEAFETTFISQQRKVEFAMMSKGLRTERPKLLVFFLVVFLVSGCNPTKITSPAYQFGKETGKKWRELSAEVKVISDWVSENSSGTAEIPEVDKLSACRTMWIVVGLPKFGLKNMAKNREDFVAGCTETIGS